MGRIRGKRNRDQDRYTYQRRDTSQAGMVAAADVRFCVKCGLASPSSGLFHGWCVSCMAAWRATADPVMLAQAAAGYSPTQCLQAPSDRAVGQILDTIATPKNDKEFLPLLLFRGPGTVGRMQSLWNFCKTMQLLNLKTTSQVVQLSVASHDALHRCGLHAPVQRMTLDGFLARVFYANDFKPAARDPLLMDYLRSFADDNRMYVFPRTRITADARWKTTRAWRSILKLKYRPLMEVWPYLEKEAAKDHLDIMMVDSLVPKQIPEQWRQDMCQDLFVAILSGEIEPDRLKADARYYIRKVWSAHPYKYGQLCLDAPIWKAGKHGGSEAFTLMDVLADTSLDAVEHHSSVWECNHRHAHTLSTMGDVLRDRNNGVAIPELVMAQPEEMDEDIFDVYQSEVKRGRSGYGTGNVRLSGDEAANFTINKAR